MIGQLNLHLTRTHHFKKVLHAEDEIAAKFGNFDNDFDLY